MRLQSLRQRRNPQAVGLAFTRGTSRSAALLVLEPPRPSQATALNRAPGLSSSTFAAFVPTRLLASAAGRQRPPSSLPPAMLNREGGRPFKPAAAQRGRLVLTCCSKPNGCRCCSSGATTKLLGSATADLNSRAVTEAVFADDNEKD